MSQSIFSYFAWGIALIALQVLVGNHIHIGGVAMPMFYLYPILILPSDTPRWVLLISAFLTGISVDIFSNTPGLTASALLIVALLRPAILQAFAPTERGDDALIPSVRTMEWGGFVRYTSAVCLVQATAFYFIEAFGFFRLGSILLSIVATTLLSVVLIAAIEMLRMRKA